MSYQELRYNYQARLGDSRFSPCPAFLTLSVNKIKFPSSVKNCRGISSTRIGKEKLSFAASSRLNWNRTAWVMRGGGGGVASTSSRKCPIDTSNEIGRRMLLRAFKPAVQRSLTFASSCAGGGGRSTANMFARGLRCPRESCDVASRATSRSSPMQRGFPSERSRRARFTRWSAVAATRHPSISNVAPVSRDLFRTAQRRAKSPVM